MWLETQASGLLDGDLTRDGHLATAGLPLHALPQHATPHRHFNAMIAHTVVIMKTVLPF